MSVALAAVQQRVNRLAAEFVTSQEQMISDIAKLKADERVRKTLTLVTLGAALHSVQDFYSHSDWVHNDFDATGAKMVKMESGGVRAPTWFEFRDRYPDPAQWSFHVQSGIYPPPGGERFTHTHRTTTTRGSCTRKLRTPGRRYGPRPTITTPVRCQRAATTHPIWATSWWP